MSRGCDPRPRILDQRDSRKIGKTPTRYQEALPPAKSHSPEQIAAALRQAEAGTPVAEIVRKLGIHEDTFCVETPVRRPGHAGDPPAAPATRRERQAQVDRGGPEPRPQDAPGDHFQKNCEAGAAARPCRLTRTFGVGIRRACDLIKLNRATYYYKSKAGRSTACCASGSRRSPLLASDTGTGASAFYCGARASRPTTSAFTGSTRPKA